MTNNFFHLFPLAAALGAALFFISTPARAQRPLGVDVSSYQGSSINWASAKSSGISFAWAKATEGLTVNDTSFVANEVNGPAAGVLMGAYHFAHPETHLGAAGAFQEAQHFWSIAGNYIKNGGYYLQPVLDIEADQPSLTSAGYTKATHSQWVNAWCSNIVSFAAASGVTVKPIVYTYTSYSTAWMDSTVTVWPLWMAQYPGSPNPQTGAPSSTSPWAPGTWTAWQYSSTGTVPGISGNCDLDVFNGTIVTLTNLVIGNTAPLPSVVLTPQLERAVDTGGSATFSGNGSGTPPLNYQWLHNGAAVPGAITAMITIANAQTNDTGSYALVVTNNSGSVTSSIVRLLVYPPQATVFADDFETNSAANWIVNKSSIDTAVTFNYQYSALGIPSAPNSTGGTTNGLQMKANLTAGAVAALSISPSGQSFSGDYRLHFDAWINVNGPFPGGGAGSTELLTGGLGTSGNRVEWTGNASADGVYFSVNGDGGSADTATTTADYNAYLGPTVQTAGTGIYIAGTDTTARGNGNVYYTTAFTNGAAAPAYQQANFPQQTGNLSKGTFGLTWHDVIISKRGSAVDWVVDGIRLAYIPSATFTASNVFVGFWDPFVSLSSNNVINFGLVDNVRVEVPAVGPLVSVQPQSQTVLLGTNVTISITASGLPAPAYQWQLNSTNLPGATNASYTIASVAPTDAGTYAVIVTNVAGSITSSNALLALVPPMPAQFQSISVQPDGTVQLSFTGDTAWNYSLQTSTNLITWTTVTNLTSTNGMFNVSAGSTTNDPVRFYRACVGP